MYTVIVGTRPEIIKMSPVIREFERQHTEYQLIHTGQHYSHELDGIFFEELQLRQPDVNLNVGSGHHGEQTAKIITGVEKELEQPCRCGRPKAVLVVGDTNTVLGGALAAVKLGIPVAHIEAGLRSYDRAMPEEINRIIVDHISDYLFSPTHHAWEILYLEGIPDTKIHIVGNTTADAVKQNLILAEEKHSLNHNLVNREYILVTIHRQENVDNKERLTGILGALGQIHDNVKLPVIFPIHPRTAKMMEQFGLSARGIQVTDPVGYLDFLNMESKARIIITDSGGIQEEACILGVPCVTVRDSTERPETVSVGANVIAGVTPEGILTAVKKMINKQNKWTHPYGDGATGKRIVSILEKRT
jgi:UDP-N-acetylglucosamine 2-epimerase (non-hydrolysing)